MRKEDISYEELLEKFKKILKVNNLKFTSQREAIIETMYNLKDHQSPESLWHSIKDRYPKLNIGIATIYRTLNLLEQSELATTLSFGAHGKKFELDTKPHHDHMICQECGQIIEFRDEEIEKRQDLIAKEHGFKLLNHSMQLFGLCKNCQKKRNKEKN